MNGRYSVYYYPGDSECFAVKILRKLFAEFPIVSVEFLEHWLMKPGEPCVTSPEFARTLVMLSPPPRDIEPEVAAQEKELQRQLVILQKAGMAQRNAMEERRENVKG